MVLISYQQRRLDKHYRKTVLRLNHLRGRQSAVNDAARRAIQAQFEENARSIKDATQIIVKAETGTLDDIKHHLRRAEELLTSIDPTRDPALYDTLVHPEKYPVPDPVYYQNHHVGECPCKYCCQGSIATHTCMLINYGTI